MSEEAFLAMPIAFQGLVVESTSRCNAKCGMCYQAAGPAGSDILGKAALDEGTIRRVLEEAIELPTLGRRFHLAGGEAFLNVGSCVSLFAHARSLGYTEISTTTNAYWARKPAQADAILREARCAGLRRMEISWDYWHLPYIPPQAINFCLIACAKWGVSSNLRILTSREHSAEEALAWLDPEALALATEIISCPVFPTGRAAKGIDPAEIYKSGDLASTCHSVLHLTINALGNVAPCCAGADQTEGLSFGNVREQSLTEIVATMNTSRMLRALVFLGPGTLLGILEKGGTNIGREFTNICHLCWTMASDRQHMSKIKAYFEEQQQIAVLDVIKRYADQPI